MIADWRKKWFEGTGGLTNSSFPFGFVQIANFSPENSSVGSWPDLRWYQTMEYGYAPNPKLKNVFMATAVDLVDNDHANNVVHPRHKYDVGYRLGMSGLTWAYGNSSIESSPPRLGSVTQTGSVATLQFISEFHPIEFEVRSKHGFDVCCNSTQCLTNANTPTPWVAVTDVDVNGANVTINLPAKCHGNQLNYIRYLWRQKPCELKQCLLYSVRTQLPVYPFRVKVK